MCRCDERLKGKTDGSKRLVYTGFRGGLEHLKIETRSINEMFASVMGECVILTPQVCWFESLAQSIMHRYAGTSTTRIHWVARGTGTPKDRDEVNKRDVCECDG